MLQPAPRGTVLWVVGKLFFTGLTRDFFVQLITLRAYLELVGAFFKEKSRFRLPFPPGTSAAGAEAGQSRARVTGCSPTAAAMSFLDRGPGACQGKGTRFSHSCSDFLRSGVGAGVCQVVVGAAGRAWPELVNVYREVLGREGVSWSCRALFTWWGKRLSPFGPGGRSVNGSWESCLGRGRAGREGWGARQSSPSYLSSPLSVHPPSPRGTPPSGTSASLQACGAASSSSWLCAAGSAWSRAASGRGGCWTGR